MSGSIHEHRPYFLFLFTSFSARQQSLCCNMDTNVQGLHNQTWQDTYLIILQYLHKAWIHFHWKSQRGEFVFAFPLRAAAGLRSSVIDCVQLHIAWMPELRETRVGPLWLDTNTGSHILNSVISSAEKTSTLTLWVHFKWLTQQKTCVVCYCGVLLLV